MIIFLFSESQSFHISAFVYVCACMCVFTSVCAFECIIPSFTPVMFTLFVSASNLTFVFFHECICVSVCVCQF